MVQWYWLQDTIPEARPVQLHARAADRAVEGTDCRTCPGGRIDFCFDGRRRGRHDRHLPAGHGAAGGPRRRPSFRSTRSAGTAARSSGRTTSRWARSSSSIRGNGWCGRSSASTSRPAGHAVDRAGLEDAAFEQGHSAGAVEAVSRGIPTCWRRSFDGPGLMMSWVKKPLLGREGANITLHQPGQGHRNRRRLRRRGLHLPGSGAAEDVRRHVPGDRQLGDRARGRQCRRRHGHSRIGYSRSRRIPAGSCRTCSTESALNPGNRTGSCAASSPASEMRPAIACFAWVTSSAAAATSASSFCRRLRLQLDIVVLANAARVANPVFDCSVEGLHGVQMGGGRFR